MILRCTFLTLLLLMTWIVRGELEVPDAVNTAESLVQFPLVIGPWRGQDSPLEPDVIKLAAFDDHLNRQYSSRDGGEIGLYVGYYQRQRQGEALHSPLHCLPGTGWHPTKTEDFQLRRQADQLSTVKKLVVERGLDRLLVLYWYQTVNRVTGSEYWRKLFLMRDALTTGRTDVALVRVIAPIHFHDQTGESKAVNLARPFAESVLPELQLRLFGE